MRLFEDMDFFFYGTKSMFVYAEKLWPDRAHNLLQCRKYMIIDYYLGDMIYPNDFIYTAQDTRSCQRIKS
jgi:hypothetical protein